MMLKAVVNLTGIVTSIVLAIVFNFLLFIIIPLTHSLFNTQKETRKNLESGPRIIAEIIKPQKKEEPKPTQPRLREVNSSTGNKNNSNKMDFKFTPDFALGNGDGIAIEQQETMESMVFNEGEVDEDAVPLSNPVPPYPVRARDLGVEGTLELEITVDIDGKVADIVILSSPHRSFEEDARKIISKWKFKPARNKGVPVKMNVHQSIEYTLNE